MRESDVLKMTQVAGRHASLDATFEDGHTTLYDKLSDGGGEGTVEDAMARDSFSRELGKSLALLEPREREVICLYFGIGHETAHTLDEIGQRYSLTRERIRQIKENALKKLKRPSINRGLREFALQV